jgi:Putative phage metallopeptidase
MPNNKAEKVDKFYDLSDEAVKTFMDIYNKKSFPFNISFQFLGCEQKSLVKITKLPDNYAFLLKKELLVSVNDLLMSVFDDESIQILIEQELDKISVNIDGKIKMIKPDLTTFSSLINKYGIDKITKANQVEELYHEQSQDEKEDFLA